MILFIIKTYNGWKNIKEMVILWDPDVKSQLFSDKMFKETVNYN